MCHSAVEKEGSGCTHCSHRGGLLDEGTAVDALAITAFVFFFRHYDFSPNMKVEPTQRYDAPILNESLERDHLPSNLSDQIPCGSRVCRVPISLFLSRLCCVTITFWGWFENICRVSQESYGPIPNRDAAREQS